MLTLKCQAMREDFKGEMVRCDKVFIGRGPTLGADYARATDDGWSYVVDQRGPKATGRKIVLCQSCKRSTKKIILECHQAPDNFAIVREGDAG